MQQLYGHNAGTHVLKTSENKVPLTGQEGIYASSALDKKKNEIILKIANVSSEKRTLNYTFTGLKKGERKVTHTILTSADADIENTLENPNAVVPSIKSMSQKDSAFEVEIAPRSFNVYVIKL